MLNIKPFLAQLSHHPGVYQMLGAKGEVIYVGKAKDLKKRVSSYFSKRPHDAKTIAMVEQIQDIAITITQTEAEAVLLECNLIKKHKPYYNVLLRDDKSYPYITISKEAYPRIDLHRGQRNRNADYFGPYPSAGAVRQTINLLQKIFHLRTCSNSYFAQRTRPCLLHQIGRCSAPCVKLIAEEDYAQAVTMTEWFLNGKSHAVTERLQSQMEAASNRLDFETAALLRNQIQRLRQIQDKQYVSNTSGDADVIALAQQAGMVVVQLITIRQGAVLGSRPYFPRVPDYADAAEILRAFITQHYLTDASHLESIPKEIILPVALEEATLLSEVLSANTRFTVNFHVPQRGERKKWLLMATASAKQALVTQLVAKSNYAERLQALQGAFSLVDIPKRIECFDISHTMGEATVASCVVFDQNGPAKSAYRRFNITGITPGDDLAAMRQAITRRFKRLQADPLGLPDVLLIDGGRIQLAAGQAVMDELGITAVQLIGVAKGPDRKPGLEVLHRIDAVPTLLPTNSPALHVIQQIRDEAHRFAITSHRQRRDKARRQSVLQEIPGIGAKRRRDLLRYFGGIQGVARASLDEIAKVPGINRQLAERIFATLHDTTL